MTTGKQLLKEFWLPFLCAVLWTFYKFGGISNDGWSLRAAIETFAPSFFLASWVSAQWYRVRKQQKVESELTSIESRIRAATSELEAKSAHIVSHVIGGEAYCRLVLTTDFVPGQPSTLMFLSCGKYPLYEVSARIVDLEAFNASVRKAVAEDLSSETRLELGTLVPGTAKLVRGSFALGNGTERNFNIFFHARNGGFTQGLRFRKVGAGWLLADYVARGNNIIFESVPDRFPRNDDGTVEWRA